MLPTEKFATKAVVIDELLEFAAELPSCNMRKASPPQIDSGEEGRFATPNSIGLAAFSSSTARLGSLRCKATAARIVVSHRLDQRVPRERLVEFGDQLLRRRRIACSGQCQSCHRTYIAVRAKIYCRKRPGYAPDPGCPSPPRATLPTPRRWRLSLSRCCAGLNRLPAESVRVHFSIFRTRLRCPLS